MATVRIGGAGINLPTFPGLAVQTTGVSAGQIKGLTNAITLAAGETFLIPSGTWLVNPGPYTFLQWLDPVSNVFKVRPSTTPSTDYIESDGTNYRLANTTGCPIGAVITVGTCTGSTNGIGVAINGVSCTPSSGASTWQTIIGGAISATIASVTGQTSVGAGYLYVPTVLIDAPPQGGLQATAIVTSLSAGTVLPGAIQVLNQGAGYSTAPNITFVNDSRDTAGSGAVMVTTLTATGNLTGLYPTNHGTPLTGVPTLSFSIGSCTATALMNFTVTGFTTGAAGGSSVGQAELVSIGNKYNGTQTTPTVNPLSATDIVFPRPARISAGVIAGVISPTGSTTGTLTIVEDGGLGIEIVPTVIIGGISYTSTTGTSQVSLFTATVGGVSDTSYLQPM
jgi:hypothetical protein